MSPLLSLVSILISIKSSIAQQYFVVSNEDLFNWEEANALCDLSIPRGQLASSHNVSHDHLMHNLCKSTGSDSCWIGLYRQSNQAQWKWIDNSEFEHSPASAPALAFDTVSASAMESQSCMSLITTQNEPTWSDGDCLNTLKNAICSKCGGLGELCCNLGDECNTNNLQCIDNKCMTSIAIDSTAYFTTTADFDKYSPNLNTTPPYPRSRGGKSGLHITHPSLFAILCVIVMVFLFNVILCVIKKRRAKMIKESENPHFTTNRVVSTDPDHQYEYHGNTTNVYDHDDDGRESISELVTDDGDGIEYDDNNYED